MLATIAMTHEEEKNLMKVSKLIIRDTLQEKIMTAIKTLSETLNGVLYEDGTGNENMDVDGLKKYITRTPAVGTYGINGLARADYSRFQNQLEEEADFSGNGLEKLGILFRKCSKAKGVREPDMHVTSSELYGGYEVLASDMDRHVLEKRYKDLGWIDMGYRGKPLIWTSNMNPGYWYMLNSMDFEFIKDDDVWMEVIKKDIPGELAQGYVLICWCNLVFYRVDYQGLFVDTSIVV
jgi:hypothetical protein